MDSDDRADNRWARWTPLLIILGLLVTFLGLWYFFPLDPNEVDSEEAAASYIRWRARWGVRPEIVSLPELVEAIQADQIETLTVKGNTLLATTTEGLRLSAQKESGISTVESLRLFGLSRAEASQLPIVIEDSGFEMNGFYYFLLFGGLMVMGFLFFQAIRSRQQGQQFHNPLSRSTHRLLGGKKEEGKLETPPITFEDVAGSEQAKLELQEIIEFLKEAEKFIKLGARVPRGVLLVGPPGTGKTLLAKAVAGEAGVSFLSTSGSEFVEMYVGVGAARVRDLFKQARDNAPAVIFVDEIDSVGRRRGGSAVSGNDEREQTLNQILVEMDGFGTDTNVIIIASTNRPDILDPALLRPGRFDRKVTLNRPDVREREAILRVHCRDKPLAVEVSLADLAKLTPGFVGADLANLVNEAAILAARRNLTEIYWSEFQDAMERIVAGPEHRDKIISEEERRIIAVHESGHAVVMHHLEHCDPIHKVSIVSRGMALGYTMPLPEQDKHLRSRELFEDEIAGLLGGRAAEEVVFQRITTGAVNDLDRATRLARAMVTRYGFSKKLGLRSFSPDGGNSFLGGGEESRDYSEQVAQTIDQEISHILETAYHRASDIISRQRQELDLLTETLLRCETIDRTQFELLMARHKTPADIETLRQGCDEESAPPVSA